MLDVVRTICLICILSGIYIAAADEKQPEYPFDDYDAARAHEVTPRRRTIPLEGVLSGGDQLHLSLTVSPTGDVVDAKASGDPETLKLWPQLEGEMRQWK